MNTTRENFSLLTDSYKLTQWQMYPEGTENVYSYYENRSGATYPYTTFFGLQMILKKYFEGMIVLQEHIEESNEFSKEHFGMDLFNKRMWQEIVDNHGGRLPIKIKSVPEGLTIPISNVLFTVEATHKRFAALVSPCETILTHVWHPSNVATIDTDIKLFLQKAFEKSVDKDQWGILPFMLHDFGFRGVSSVESAGMGAAAHLLNFMGTDTIIGINYAKRYYGAKMAGFSVPASEHSVMCSLGEDGEEEMIDRVISEYPTGILSNVSDSYSIVRAIKLYGTKFRKKILDRGGKFVVRPDSPRFKGDTAADQIVWISNELFKYFGGITNSKGYKVFHPKIGGIYGDGLSVQEIKESITALMDNGFAASNWVFGMGGGLLQKHNRDTQRSAFKCSAQFRDGKWVDNWKKPLDLTKASKKGRLKLIRDNGSYATVGIDDPREDVLTTVFENGILTREWTWDEVKSNSQVPSGL